MCINVLQEFVKYYMKLSSVRSSASIVQQIGENPEENVQHKLPFMMIFKKVIDLHGWVTQIRFKWLGQI